MDPLYCFKKPKRQTNSYWLHENTHILHTQIGQAVVCPDLALILIYFLATSSIVTYFLRRCSVTSYVFFTPLLSDQVSKSDTAKLNAFRWLPRQPH